MTVQKTTTNDNSAYYYELFMLAKEEADYLRGKLMRVRDMAMRGTGKTDLSGIYHEADSALHGDERASCPANDLPTRHAG